MLEEIEIEITRSIELKQQVLADKELLGLIQKLAIDCIDCLKSGGKIVFCGNGGSFADSQHLAAELVSRLRFNRSALPAIALGTNSSNLTAIGNDYGYDKIFSREIEAIADKKDLLIAISTSGNSGNVLEAVRTAQQLNLTVWGWTGREGGLLTENCLCIKVPSGQTDKVQEVHIMIGHILCHLIEKSIFKPN
jgi:D-sedoheptulose 7-phosphate isomerase